MEPATQEADNLITIQNMGESTPQLQYVEIDTSRTSLFSRFLKRRSNKVKTVKQETCPRSEIDDNEAVRVVASSSGGFKGKYSDEVVTPKSSCATATQQSTQQC